MPLGPVVLMQLICTLRTENVHNKLSPLLSVTIDVMRSLHAFDAGGRARAATGIIQALPMAKEAGVDSSQALALVDWDG